MFIVDNFPTKADENKKNVERLRYDPARLWCFAATFISQSFSTKSSVPRTGGLIALRKTGIFFHIVKKGKKGFFYETILL